MEAKSEKIENEADVGQKDKLKLDLEEVQESVERQGELSALGRIHKIKSRYAMEAETRCLKEGIHAEDLKELPKDLLERMNAEIAAVEEEFTTDGVCFAYCQFGEIVKDYQAGRRVEIEGFGPYLRYYFSQLFVKEYAKVELTEEDEVGIQMMLAFLELMPDAKVVSLFDEYNFGTTANVVGGGTPADISEHLTEGPGYERGRLINESQILRDEFRKWVEGVLRAKGAIKKGAIEGPEADYVLVSETDKISDAKRLVNKLSDQGMIEGDVDSDTGEIWYQGNIRTCEDPRYLRIKLRDAEGHWECAALDASGYVDNPEEKREDKNRNANITSLVILPDDARPGKTDFKVQRAQVWELLHALKDENDQPVFNSTRVHDVFVRKGTKANVAVNVMATSLEAVGA